MKFRLLINIFYIIPIFILLIPETKASSKPKSKKQLPKQSIAKYEGSMSLEKMDKIVKKLDSKAIYNSKVQWRFSIEKVPVMIIADKKSNRMRVLVPIRKADQLTYQELKHIMQANFDSVLDSRYAIAKNILWAAYIHPLAELHEKQFISAYRPDC